MEYCTKCKEMVEPDIQKQSMLSTCDDIRFFHDVYYDECPECNTPIGNNRHDALNYRIYSEKLDFYKKLLINGREDCRKEV